MIYQTEGDIVTSCGTGDMPGFVGPDFPGVPISRLRLLDGEIVDLHTLTDHNFWIDSAGQKHVIAGDGWQELSCDGADELQLVNGTWYFIDPADIAIRDLKAYAANVRWIKQTGGITVSGIPVRTDDKTRNEISAARSDAALVPDWSTAWKLGDGTFVTIDTATINAIATAVSQHVRNCFSTEESVAADIDSGDITTTAEIDEAFA